MKQKRENKNGKTKTQQSDKNRKINKTKKPKLRYPVQFSCF